MTAIQLGFDALDRAADNHCDEIEDFVVLARQLALEAGPKGITVSDLRREANLPAGKGRQWSFLGAVMKRAGLKPTDVFRRSDVEATHGNLNRVWVL